VNAQLSGTVVGQPPNASIAFVLVLENKGLQEVTILDPLEFLSLEMATLGDKLIRLPRRVSKFVPNVAKPEGLTAGVTADVPYPAPVQLRHIVRPNGLTSQKEDTITILPGLKIQLEFDSEPVVMQKVIEALRTETGEAAKSFKARATMSLVAAPPQPGVGGRLLDSDWISFAVPSSY
jgi:hypothetical protein